MSHLVVAEVSQFLKHTLYLGLKESEVTAQLINNEDDILLTNPGQTAVPQGRSRQISLWLYQVLPNEHLRNPPFAREAEGPANAPTNDDALFYPPLYVNLLYLLTPSIQPDNTAKGQLADQQILGRALQIFHDQGILRMESRETPRQADELHITLASRTIQELAEVWEAMQQPYRLSVCYEVRAVRIVSRRRLAGGRVSERLSRFSAPPLVEA